MYEGLAESARANAERAKNAVKNAAAEAERAAAETTKAMERAASVRKTNEQKASNFTKDQSLDKDLRARLVPIEVARRREEALARERYGWSEERLAQELNSISERFNKEEEAQRRLVEMKKAQRNAEQDIARYNELVQKAKEYVAEVEKANEILQNPASSSAEKQAALQMKSTSLDEAKAAAEEAQKAADALNNLAPIGDKMVLPADKISGLLLARIARQAEGGTRDSRPRSATLKRTPFIRETAVRTGHRGRGETEGDHRAWLGEAEVRSIQLTPQVSVSVGGILSELSVLSCIVSVASVPSCGI
jgi:hypothetical protein